MSMSIVCQRFCRTGVALSPRITSFLGSSSSIRRCCEEHSSRRGNSSSAHVGADHRFDISRTIRNGHNPRRGSFAMSTAPEAENPTRPSIHPTVESIRSARKSYGPSVSVGFVPTMGALHEGHLSLFRAARSENDVVVASIFVNPTQFGEGEDLEKYPRQLEKDVDLLASIGVDHVFAPSSDTMYGKNHVTYLEPTGFDKTREGIARPNHFRGVATVVAKLFNIVQPTNAYFGQKDAVQCVLIRRIVDDLNMNINVRILDTVRERDGLAMSSRNAYLMAEQRDKAPIVYKALCAAREVFESRFARGMEEVDAAALQEVVENILRTEPLISEVQYVAVDDLETMQPLEKVGSGGCIVSLACILGTVRLIDNIVLS
ncbi:hypothetical protein ACHAW5_001637 [Stephanodiscus triporus]|uniref:Pantoate--beta-alanine ligase n=1 Tax=Stephanodiscus triporus TaxID=2934178 RepID=A0ABD3Q0I1_9STRA